MNIRPSRPIGYIGNLPIPGFPHPPTSPTAKVYARSDIPK
jgi:hypothetical protein